MQYSYLPSWISFLVDVQKAADTGREVIQAIQGRLAEMPKATRPKLLLFGESLGSYGTEEAFKNVDQMISGVDGALLVGPVFQNHIHNAVTDDRDKGSPFWRPVYKHGEHVRFAVAPSDLSQPPTRVDVAADRLPAELERSDHVLEPQSDLEPARVARPIRAVPTSRRTCSGRRS